MWSLDGKTVVVAGFARTGKAVVDFLTGHPCSVIVSEARAESEFPDARRNYPGVTFEWGGHRDETFLKADLIILSPGIPDSIQPVASARAKGVAVFSEIELAFRHLNGTLIAITGTNGKSTTTELAGAMLREGGKNAYVCGNIGTPLIEFCNRSQPKDYYVAEISSFQLETIQNFRPHIAAVLNLAEDHLDRYPSVEPYYQAKMRIFQNQKRSDFAVLNYDDPYLRSRTDFIPAEKFWFSRNQIPPSGVYSKGDLVRVISGMSIVNYGLGTLKGIHNLENTLCAASISILCGVLPKAMQKALESFHGLPHRMQWVAEKNGVKYYDDSKATNVDSVLKSLQSFPGNILLIMGGKDKGCDYRPLREVAAGRVKQLLLIGEAKERIAKELGDLMSPLLCSTLPEAVERAAETARPGDIVLLSPACSSFDMFTDYAERGNVFRQAVESL